MTEDEAKTKWCPMVRFGHVAGMAINRYAQMQKGAVDSWYEQTRCIASECMMWRYNIANATNGPGFCGLAGDPYRDMVPVIHSVPKSVKAANA